MVKRITSDVALSEKRLLSIDEFCAYSNLGKNTATRLSKSIGADVMIGRRFLVDRVKFDTWCNEKTGA